MPRLNHRRSTPQFLQILLLPAAALTLAAGCGSSEEGPSVAVVPPSAGAGGASGAGAPSTPPLPAPSPGAGATRGEGSPPLAGLSGGAGDGPVVVAPPASPPDDVACDASTANPSGYCWQSVVIGGGGFVSGIIASTTQANLIYARTDVGGAYRWSEASARWIPLNDWVSEDEIGLLGVESLALDPNEPNRVYMLAGIDYFNNGKTAVLSSSDYGVTFDVHEVTAQFKAHGNGAGRQSGERLAVDPIDGSVLFTGTRANGLFRSADRGETWSRADGLDVTTTPNGNGIAFVVFDPAAGELDGVARHLFVGVSRAGEPNLYESEDAGATFTEVAGQPTTFVPQRAALGKDGVLHVSYANGAGPAPSNVDPMDRGAIFKLELASGTWTEITPLRDGQNRGFGGISVDESDPKRLVATTINTYQQQPWGYGDRIFLSLDAGASWTDLIGAGRVTMATNDTPWIENNALHWAGSVQIDPFNSERAFVTSGNGIFMTRDLTATDSTWEFSVKGLEEMVPLDAVSVSGGVLASAVGDYDGFIHTDPKRSPEGGRYEPSMGTTRSVAVAALDPTHMARVGDDLYVSGDSAASWSRVTRPSEATGGRATFSTDGSSLLWSVGRTAFRSPDQGASWAPVAGLNVDTIIEADALNPNKFYAYDPMGGAVWASTDAGSSFSITAMLPGGGERRIRSVPGVEGDVWVALDAGGVQRSTDSGSTFTAVAAVQSCRALGFGAARSAGGFPAVYLWGAAGGGPRGLYRSDDAGLTFERINDDAHEYGGPANGAFVLGDANVYGRVYMSSPGRGLIMGELVRPVD